MNIKAPEHYEALLSTRLSLNEKALSFVAVCGIKPLGQALGHNRRLSVSATTANPGAMTSPRFRSCQILRNPFRKPKSN